MSELFRNRARALSFGSIAQDYDRHRPSYPDAMVRDLLLTNPRDVLDVGAGTGKAARLFTAQGIDVLCVEPDAAMAQVAASHGLEVEVAAFEQWDAQGRDFDLLISGQAWHWVDPVAGAARAREVLRADGSMALFWNVDSVDDRTADALDAVYLREAPELMGSRVRRGGGDDGRSAVADALVAGGFDDVGWREYPWQRAFDRDAWVAVQATYSNHHLLPDDQRTRLLDGIAATVDELGGRVVASFTTHLLSARNPG